MRSPRAYLLLEVTIAASITAVSLLALLLLLGDASTKSTITAHDETAQELVMQGIERARMKGYAGVATLAPALVPGLMGKYTRGTTVTTGTETLFGAQAINFKDATVTVTEGLPVRTHTAVLRLYE